MGSNPPLIMNSTLSLPSRSGRWIQIAIICGCVLLGMLLLVPVLLANQVRSERARLAACERYERVDCDPSFIWLLMK